MAAELEFSNEILKLHLSNPVEPIGKVVIGTVQAISTTLQT